MATRRNVLKLTALFTFFPEQLVLSQTGLKEKGTKEVSREAGRLYSFIGKDGLEKVFQDEYDRGGYAKLKVRSAPNIAQLPYEWIINSLKLSSSNPLVMLYAGGGDDIASLLFAYLARKHSSDNLPIRIICTEVDDNMPNSFQMQLGFLKDKGIPGYVKEERRIGRLTEINFRIYPLDAAEFDITYRIRARSNEFFAIEDIKEANIFRENYSLGLNNQRFIAHMLMAGYRENRPKNRPVILMMPDYEDSGGYYNHMAGNALPQQYISREELVRLEEKVGSRIWALDFKSDRLSNERPFRDIPGCLMLSRGYDGCSCDDCIGRIRKNEEQLRSNYLVLMLIKPRDLKNISEQELSARLIRAFQYTSETKK